METVKYSYRIRLRKRVVKSFDFELNTNTGDLIHTTVLENIPDWTALSYQQCPHCPLEKEQHSHCPLAVQLARIIDALHDTRSYDEVDMEVTTPTRTIVQTVELQQVVGSMVGLVSPTCGCPKTAYMKPMARFHLPLASEEETLFRVTGMFLLAQYFSGKKKMDLHGLTEIYEELHIVNKHIASRLKHATQSDSSKNAIALLDMYSNLMPLLIEDSLPEIQGLFSAYLQGTQQAAVTKKEIKKQTTEADLALQAFMGDVEVDELESLLGTQKIKAVTDEVVTGSDAPKKTFGRAVFSLPDDPAS